MPVEPMPRLHGNMSEVYRRKVADLSEHLADPASSRVALEIIRGLIEKVQVLPASGGSRPDIILTGELAAMLRLSLDDGVSKTLTAAQVEARAAGGSGLFYSSVKVVAGIGFEPMTFRL